MRNVLQHLRSNVVAYLALFVALGGTATAASTALKANSVGSTQIKNGSVKTQDLALSARMSSSNKFFTRAVTAVVLDPNTQAVVDSLSGAVKGEKGDKGDPIVGPQGSQGAAGSDGSQGPQGSSGPRGAALGYLHANGDGSLDANRTLNAAVSHVAGGYYCVDAADGTPLKNVAATIDASTFPNADLSIFMTVPDPGAPCDGHSFVVRIMRATGDTTNPYAGEDHSFFATLN